MILQAHTLRFWIVLAASVAVIFTPACLIAQTPIGCSSDFPASISAPGEKDEYLLSASNGDRLRVRGYSASAGIQLLIEVFSPANVLLDSELADATGFAEIDSLSLNAGNGDYKIVVSDGVGSQTGSYGLSVQILNSTACASALDCDYDFPAKSLDYLAEMDAYHLPVSSTTDRYRIRWLLVSANPEWRMDIYRPNGTWHSTLQQNGAGLVELDSFSFPQSGEWFFIVHDQGGDETGSYYLAIQKLNDPACTSGALDCDYDFPAKSLDYLAEMDAYHLPVSSTTDRYRIRWLLVSANPEWRMDIYRPNGTWHSTLQQNGAGLVELDSFSFPATGEWFFIVHDQGGDETGSYYLAIQKLNDPACTSGALDCDYDFPAKSLDYLAEMDAYHLPVSSTTDRYRIRWLLVSANPEWRMDIYRPNGTWHSTLQQNGAGLVELDSFSFPATGEWFFIVHDQGGDETGSYYLAIQKLNDPACTSGALDCDYDFPAKSLDYLAEMDAYHLPVSSTTDRYRIRWLLVSANPEWRMDIYRPNGTWHSTLQQNGAGLVELDSFSFPQSGEWFFIVHDQGGDETGSYYLAIQKLNDPACTSGALDCDYDFPAKSLDYLAEMDAYHLPVSSTTDRYRIRWLLVSANPEWRMDIYRPNGTWHSTLQQNGAGLVELDSFSFPQSGEWFFIVHDQGGDETGSYYLAIQKLNDPACTSGALDCDYDFPAKSLDYLAEMDAYHLPVSSTTDRYRIRWLLVSANPEWRMDIYRPNGTWHSTLQQNGAGLVELDSFSFPATGEWFFIVHDQGGDETGSYYLAIQKLNDPACTSGALDCDYDFPAKSLDYLAEMDAYHLPVSSTTDRYRIRWLLVSANPEWRMDIYRPNGTWHSTLQQNGAGLVELDSFSFPATGEWFFIVHDQGGDETGSYYLAIQKLNDPACTSGALDCDYDFPAKSLDYLAEMDAYHLPVSSTTDRYRIRWLLVSANPEWRMDIYRPSGTWHSTLQQNGAGLVELDSFSFPQSGEWFFIVHDQGGDETGSYYLAIQKLNDPACATTIICGNSTSTDLSYQAEMDAYHFAAQAGDNVSITMTGGTGTLHENLHLYNPVGILLASASVTDNTGTASLSNVPLLADGTYFIVAAETEGDNTGSYTLGLTCTSAPQPPGQIACDGEVSGSISVLGEVDEYTFDGQAGERVIIRMQGEFSSLDAKIELYDPAGTLIASDANTSGGLARIGSPAFLLPATGIYTIRASDNGNNDTENYGLSLQILKVSCAQAIDGDDDLPTTSINLNAEMDAYYFDAQAGEQIIIKMQGEFSSLDPAVELYYLPTGAQVASSTAPAGGLARIGNPTATLAQAGTYLLVVMDDEGSDDQENYGLSMQILSTTFAQLIDGDDDLFSSIGINAEMDAYYFDAQAGEQLIVRMQGEFSSLDPAVELYYLPTGAQVASSTAPAGGLARIGNPTTTLAQTGTYLLVVMDDEGSDDQENYGLSLQILKASFAQPIDGDDDLTSSINLNGEMDAYYFDAQAGEQLIVRMQGEFSSLDPAVELYYLPTGAQVGSSTAPAGGLARIGNPTTTLAQSGTYLLVVMDDEGSDDQENYGLSLQILKASFAQPIDGDDDLTSSINLNGEMDAYYFDAQAGEQLIVRMQGEFSSLDPAVELYYLPTGAQVGSSTAPAGGLARIGNPTTTLAQSGTYLLVVMDDEGSDDQENYGLSMQVLDAAFALPIGCSEDRLASIDQNAEMDAYFFDGQAGERFIVQMQGEFSSLDPAIELYYLPTGAQVGSSTAPAGGLARIGNPSATLAQSGTYLLVVMDDEGSDNQEEYDLSLQILTTVCGTPVSCGSTVEGSILQKGEIEAYYFAMQADSSFTATLVGSGMEPDIIVFSPDGSSWPDWDAYNGTAQVTVPAVGSGGNYFIIVQEHNGDGTGGYTLHLECAAGAPCAAPSFAWLSAPNSVCQNTPLTLGIANADASFNFELFQNGATTEQVVAGTGSNIFFSPIALTQGSTFTVRATLKTDAGCFFDLTPALDVSVSAAPDLSWLPAPASVCTGSSVTLSIASADAGFNFQLYKDDEASGSPVSGTGGNLSFAPVDVSQNSTFTVTATLKTDANCFFDLSPPLELEVGALSIFYRVFPETAFNNNGRIDSICISSGTPPFTLEYEPNRGAAETGLPGPCLENMAITGLRAGFYKLTITDAAGCSVTLVIEVPNPDRPRVGFPEKPFLTPNGDGINDRLVYEGLFIYPDASELTVYNRYGSVILHEKPYLNNWEVTYNGEPVPDGTYFYTLRLFIAEEETVYTGFITVVR